MACSSPRHSGPWPQRHRLLPAAPQDWNRTGIGAWVAGSTLRIWRRWDCSAPPRRQRCTDPTVCLPTVCWDTGRVEREFIIRAISHILIKKKKDLLLFRWKDVFYPHQVLTISWTINCRSCSNFALCSCWRLNEGCLTLWSGCTRDVILILIEKKKKKKESLKQW